MAYDEDLAERVRGIVVDAGFADVSERKMFGGLAFMLGEHMFVGIVGAELMVRLDHDTVARSLRTEEHVREMDFTGRPARNMVFVGPEGVRAAALRRWVDAAAEHVRTLPPKPAKRPRASAG